MNEDCDKVVPYQICLRTRSSNFCVAGCGYKYSDVLRVQTNI